MVRLVLSLTPRERQEFKELYPYDYDYVSLFNHIIKNKGLDETAFLEQLVAQKGDKASSKNVNLSVIKSYLLDKILNSLRSSNKNPTAAVYMNLTYSDILISKGVYDVAESYLEETNQLCQDNFLAQEELICFRQTKQIGIVNNKGLLGKDAAAKLKRYDLHLDMLAKEKDLTIFAENATSFGFYNVMPSPDIFFDTMTKINQMVVLEEYPFIFKQHLRIMKASTEVFHSVEGDPVEKINAAYIFAIEEWKNNQSIMAYNGYWFLGFAFGYFLLLALTGANEAQITAFLEILSVFEEKTKSSVERNRALELKHVCQLMQLKNSNDDKKYAKTLKLKEKFEKDIDPNFQRNAQIKIWEEYNYIYAYQQLNNYSAVIDICNGLLHDKDYNVKNFMIFYSPVYVAYLQAHYELGSFKFLKYEIDKCKAVLEKNNALGDFEEEFLKLMRLLVSNQNNKAKLLNGLELHQENFKIISEQGFFKSNFKMFDIDGWIEELKKRYSK